MLPVLADGDCLLVWRGPACSPGDLVVARLRELPDVLVVKRAVEPRDGGWWLASDNPAVRGLGVTEGVGDVEGRVLLRYWPLPARRLRGV